MAYQVMTKARVRRMKAAARCKPSPSGQHYWVETYPRSDVWVCKHCGEVRHFNAERREKEHDEDND